MKTPLSQRLRALGAATLLACVVGAGTAVVLAAPAQAAPTAPGTPIPPHVFAPYFYSNSAADTLFQASQESGAKYLTLAFLQTRKHGDCTVYWNGRADSPIGPTYAAGIAAIRAAGGDVYPSFGGAAATSGSLTELADSCQDVNAIADEFKRVITAYDFTRIDLDIEEESLANPVNWPAIDRRNKAIKIVQDWARDTGRTVEFVYTQPTFTDGLNNGSMFLLQNAVNNGTRIDGIHLMTFNFYDDISEACKAKTGPPHDMAAATFKAANATYNILHGLYPQKTPAQLWGMIGIITMPGPSDFGECETFTTEDAVKVLNWAIQKNIHGLSFWSLQRDQRATSRTYNWKPYQFTRTFAPFTHGDNSAQTAITATVTGGPLSLSTGDMSPVALPAVALNGQDQVVTGPLGHVTVVDARGTNVGWSLTGQVSDFRSPGNQTIAAANLGWAPTAKLVPGGMNLVRTISDSVVTAGTAKAPGSGLSTPQPLCSSAAGASTGTFDCGATLNLGVPYNAALGTYTGVLTLTLV
ncbi:glycosyl hydrolase family 18 protein [Dactylosporangium sp. NPDC000555]|uniref:glycosyl hydrolase family 18 protein n=1 Tax=Dactylosporangium sp. NPDC000555 TaxID=3154260 RepID=UPI00331AD36E